MLYFRYIFEPFGNRIKWIDIADQTGSSLRDIEQATHEMRFALPGVEVRVCPLASTPVRGFGQALILAVDDVEWEGRLPDKAIRASEEGAVLGFLNPQERTTVLIGPEVFRQWLWNRRKRNLCFLYYGIIRTARSWFRAHCLER